MKMKAEELTDDRFVNNLDEYMLQLNDGMIAPYAPTVEEYGAAISLYGTVSDPSKKCSNIFGHNIPCSAYIFFLLQKFSLHKTI